MCGAGPPRAPEHAHSLGMLLDSHSRVIRDLRLSITDRCNFRCVYCMEPGTVFRPPSALLSVSELARAAHACIDLGIRHIRLTGGEPTLHPHLTTIIRRIAELGPDDLSMTTNGWRLDSASLRMWQDSGLRRITISLDAVTEPQFQRITRSTVTVRTIIAGIERAMAAGLGPVKINAVIMRDWNEDQIVPLAALARRLSIEVRFIEFMPLDSARQWTIESVVSASEILARIHSAFPLDHIGRDDPASTSLQFAFADGAPGRIGIIAPVSRPFCGACNRLRITADGKVRPCLFSTSEWDLLPLLRAEEPVEKIRAFLVDAAWTKQAGHGISSPAFERPERSMSAIGG